MRAFTFLSLLLWATANAQFDCEIREDDYDRAARMSRNFLAGVSTRWPGGIMPYVLSSSFSASTAARIRQVMASIEANTCIRFIPRTNQRTYVNIITGSSGCYAFLGYNPNRQNTDLHLQDPGCTSIGTIAHEFFHIFGFNHEQTRPDRDQHVRINWANMNTNRANNFFRMAGANENPLPPVCNPNSGATSFDNCYAGFRAETFNMPYDYGSVMHYSTGGFSINGQPTITVLNGQSIGQRGGPSPTDWAKVRAAYQCSTAATTTPAPPSTTPAPSTTCAMNCFNSPGSFSTQYNVIKNLVDMSIALRTSTGAGGMTISVDSSTTDAGVYSYEVNVARILNMAVREGTSNMPLCLNKYFNNNAYYSGPWQCQDRCAADSTMSTDSTFATRVSSNAASQVRYGLFLANHCMSNANCSPGFNSDTSKRLTFVLANSAFVSPANYAGLGGERIVLGVQGAVAGQVNGLATSGMSFSTTADSNAQQAAAQLATCMRNGCCNSSGRRRRRRSEFRVETKPLFQ